MTSRQDDTDRRFLLDEMACEDARRILVAARARWPGLVALTHASCPLPSRPFVISPTSPEDGNRLRRRFRDGFGQAPGSDDSDSEGAFAERERATAG